MDNIRFGSFVAQLRKERGLTQKELAQRLHVTDKAVSKWEDRTGISRPEAAGAPGPDPGGLSGGAAPGGADLFPHSVRGGGGTGGGPRYGPVPADHRPALSPAVPVGLHRRGGLLLPLSAAVPGLRRLPALLSLGDRAPDGGHRQRGGPHRYHHFLGSPVPRLVPAGTAGPPVRRLRRTGFPGSTAWRGG